MGRRGEGKGEGGREREGVRVAFDGDSIGECCLGRRVGTAREC